MTAVVYTQAEVDALLAKVATTPGPAGPAGPAGPVGPAGAPGPGLVVSKTEPVGAPDGTVWVAL